MQNRYKAVATFIIMSNDANESGVVDFVWVPGEELVDEFRLE